MIHLDTSALVGALTGPRAAGPTLRRFFADGERLGISTIVLYEWWRGPRTRAELEDQETFFRSTQAFPLGWNEAAIAAKIHRQLRTTRNRSNDIAIAACAIAHAAALWTLNPRDFADIPGLELIG
jgi:predicted nucleic acid-binding protein